MLEQAEELSRLEDVSEEEIVVKSKSRVKKIKVLHQLAVIPLKLYCCSFAIQRSVILCCRNLI